ncbi:hypothetical protein DB30_07254 [Enhygromyxa salina]|uniref:YfdX protein n=1 Tax=Enhygromyxa salina TaxID=215803 RepID=A0A0C2D1M4_9BACT|nr:YfdX family protein [Enhygromyxa salina]KIG14067.1 hypothetical protein DB30_07254 [Enhygromyxa salina]
MKSSHSILSTSVLTATLLALVGCEKPSELGKSKSTPSEMGKKAPEPPADDKPITVEATAGQPGTDTPDKTVDAAAIDAEVAAPAEDPSAKILVETGREVATAIGEAVEALDAEQADAAKESLTKAAAGLDKIKATRPNVDILVEVWRGKHTLAVAATEPAFDTVPLLAMWTKINAHGEDIKARHELRKGQQPDTVSKADKSEDLALIEGSLIYTELDLPIATTQIHVLGAQQLLEQGKLGQAKDLLVRAGASFGVIQIVASTPEFQAHQLVKDAHAAVERGDFAEAKRSLTAAADQLGPLAEDQGDPQEKKLVAMLLEEIAPLRTGLDRGDAKDTKQLEAFARVERHAMSLVRRQAMQAVMASRQEQELVALVDALMWLEIAESEGLSDATRSMRAADHLAHAQSILASARDKAAPTTKPKFTELFGRVEKLAKLDSAKSRKADEIAAELRRIGFDLRMMMLDLGMTPAEQAAPDKAADKPKAKPTPKNKQPSQG